MRAKAVRTDLDLLASHELHEFAMRIVLCERCGVVIPQLSRHIHDQTQCERRFVPCRHLQYGCSAQLVWRDRQLSETAHCRRAPR